VADPSGTAASTPFAATDRRSSAAVLRDVLRRPGRLVWLVLVWFALQGDLSWANLVAGVLVGLGVLLAVPPAVRAHPSRIAPLPALGYLAVFGRDLVVATLEVAVQVFWPVARLRPAVLEVPLGTRDRALVALVSNTISLTPGTLTIEVDVDRGLIWVHVLHLADRPGAAEDVVEQARALVRGGARVLGVDLDAGLGAATDGAADAGGSAARAPRGRS